MGPFLNFPMSKKRTFLNFPNLQKTNFLNISQCTKSDPLHLLISKARPKNITTKKHERHKNHAIGRFLWFYGSARALFFPKGSQFKDELTQTVSYKNPNLKKWIHLCDFVLVMASDPRPFFSYWVLSWTCNVQKRTPLNELLHKWYWKGHFWPWGCPDRVFSCSRGVLFWKWYSRYQVPPGT